MILAELKKEKNKVQAHSSLPVLKSTRLSQIFLPKQSSFLLKLNLPTVITREKMKNNCLV